MGFFRARILQWVAISSSPGFSPPRDWSRISSTGRQILYHWASWEAQWLNSVVQSFSQNFPWALYRDVMWENSRKLACLDDDNFLPESLIYLLGFGSIISRMFLKISDSPIVWNLSFLREMGMYEFGKKGFRIIHYAGNLFLPWCTLPPVRVNS